MRSFSIFTYLRFQQVFACVWAWTAARPGLKIMPTGHGLGLKIPRMTLFCLVNINRENLGIPQFKLQDGHAVVLSPFPVVRIPCEVNGVECLDTGRTGEPRGRSFTDRGRAWGGASHALKVCGVREEVPQSAEFAARLEQLHVQFESREEEMVVKQAAGNHI